MHELGVGLGWGEGWWTTENKDKMSRRSKLNFRHGL